MFDMKRSLLWRMFDMKRSLLWIIIVGMAVLLVGSFSMGSKNKPAAEKTTTMETKETDTRFLPLEVDDTGEVLPLQGVGPNGEEPVGVDAVEGLLTEADIQKIKNGGYTAVICLHTTMNDWAQLQIKGIEATLEKYGVELLAITDAEAKVDKQISDVESAIQLDPDLIIAVPLDNDATAAAFKKAADKGIVLSFMDTVPTGFVYPDDYAGMGTADNWSCGKASAEILGDYLGGKGKVALLHLGFMMYGTDQRSKAVKKTLRDKYPNIEVVAEQEVITPEQVANATEDILIAHPDLDGIWVVVDMGGMVSAGVVDNMGADVVVTTVDLSHDSAFSIASGGSLIGTGAQHPYDQGIAETLIGLVALVGKTAPPFVVVPAEKVTRESMVRSWYRVFREDMPEEIKDALAD
jgi:ribose transport system substrate-binding protein